MYKNCRNILCKNVVNFMHGIESYFVDHNLKLHFAF